MVRVTGGSESVEPPTETEAAAKSTAAATKEPAKAAPKAREPEPPLGYSISSQHVAARLKQVRDCPSQYNTSAYALAHLRSYDMCILIITTEMMYNL